MIGRIILSFFVSCFAGAILSGLVLNPFYNRGFVYFFIFSLVFNLSFFLLIPVFIWVNYRYRELSPSEILVKLNVYHLFMSMLLFILINYLISTFVNRLNPRDLYIHLLYYVFYGIGSGIVWSAFFKKIEKD